MDRVIYWIFVIAFAIGAIGWVLLGLLLAGVGLSYAWALGDEELMLLAFPVAVAVAALTAIGGVRLACEAIREAKVLCR